MINIFTDGACTNNGKRNSKGGIGVHYPNNELEDISEQFLLNPITNQRAELAAIYVALKNTRKNFPEIKNINIFTDSKYSIDCFTKWINGWKKKDWKNWKGKNVLNQDLLKAIDKYICVYEYNINFEHVKAHTNNDDYNSIHNAIADKLATNGINKK